MEKLIQNVEMLLYDGPSPFLPHLNLVMQRDSIPTRISHGRLLLPRLVNGARAHGVTGIVAPLISNHFEIVISRDEPDARQVGLVRRIFVRSQQEGSDTDAFHWAVEIHRPMRAMPEIRAMLIRLAPRAKNCTGMASVRLRDVWHFSRSFSIANPRSHSLKRCDGGQYTWCMHRAIDHLRNAVSRFRNGDFRGPHHVTLREPYPQPTHSIPMLPCHPDIIPRRLRPGIPSFPVTFSSAQPGFRRQLARSQLTMKIPRDPKFVGQSSIFRTPERFLERHVDFGFPSQTRIDGIHISF